MSHDQLRVAERNAAAAGLTNVAFQAASAYDTSLPEQSFDLVYSRFLMCHLIHGITRRSVCGLKKLACCKPSLISKKGRGDPVGLAELPVFYCWRAAGFCNDIHNDDEGYFDAFLPWPAANLGSGYRVAAQELLARVSLERIRRLS